MTSNQDLLALLQRPLEPTFYPKDDGANGKIVLHVPESYVNDRYKPIISEINSRFSGTESRSVPIRELPVPDIGFAEAVDKRGAFSLFIPKHREIAGKLIKVFMDQKDGQALMSAASFARERLNPVLFQYALSVAIQHREDTKDLPIPSMLELFPDQFVDPAIFPKLREEGAIVTNNKRNAIEIERNFTATDREIEQRMAYFREDIGVNMHHWHWHLVYPGDGPDSVVAKDRRGELFFYMHNQLIARYNTDRFCNKLPKVKSFSNFREPIAEAYFPKMIRSSNNRGYPARHADTILKDVNRVDNNTEVSVSDLERWRDRIMEAIDAQFVFNSKGERVNLDVSKGIDILGDIVENTKLSVNRQLYGNLHNMGHNVVAYVHDPDSRFKEDYGVMGDVTTAMRDPFFYKWHSFIDDLFMRHKSLLPQYTSNELSYNGVAVTSAEVTLTSRPGVKNRLLTFWQRSQVDLAAGLDFGPEGNIIATFTHLQHAPFEYRLQINNTNGSAKRGTCRIFIAPKQDERGQAIPFKEQKRYMIEMDKFTVNLKSGLNTIVRRDNQSSVTVAYERTFRAIGKANQPTKADELAKFRFCGCGWPAHMLLPKGSPEGMLFDLFVMVSNYQNDTVNQEFDENIDCNDAHSFCGLRDKLYPDKRSMGFPFDRTSSAANLQNFIQGYPNMKSAEISILFKDTIVART